VESRLAEQAHRQIAYAALPAPDKPEAPVDDLEDDAPVDAPPNPDN
jgi:hypothetical protein